MCRITRRWPFCIVRRLRGRALRVNRLQRDVDGGCEKKKKRKKLKKKMKIKIKTAFPSGGEKHTSVWRQLHRRRRVVGPYGWRGWCVETGNSFSTYNPTPPLYPVRPPLPSYWSFHLDILLRLSSPSYRPRPHPSLSPPPLFASSSLWLQQTSRLQITHDDDDSLREVVHGGDVRACVRTSVRAREYGPATGTAVSSCTSPTFPIITSTETHPVRRFRDIYIQYYILLYRFYYYSNVPKVSDDSSSYSRLLQRVSSKNGNMKIIKIKKIYLRRRERERGDYFHAHANAAFNPIFVALKLQWVVVVRSFVMNVII